MENKKKFQLIRIIIKSLAFLLIINYGFIFIKNLPLGNLSFYNILFEGRDRLPFGETPADSYSLTMSNMDAMLASHRISGIKDEDIFKIAIVGDSSIWGFRQENEHTLVGYLNSVDQNECIGKKVEFFNLGYPSLSIFKDLLIIDSIQKYDPDLIIWFITLESLTVKEQLSSPLVSNNPLQLNKIIEKYDLDFEKEKINNTDFTLLNRKRELADIWRLQAFGIPWSATGIDQVISESYSPAQRDFDEEINFKNIPIDKFSESDLALEIIHKAKRTLKTDLIIINEPILISNGRNSEIRYNFYYPRWAYDSYREIAKEFMSEKGLEYYDLWDIVPEAEFTNSAIHLTTEGEEVLVKRVDEIVKEYCSNKR